MALFVWISMATALWHFTIFIPDRFPGGMIGACVCANGAAIAGGLAWEGFSLPPLAEVAVIDAAIGGLAGTAGLIAAYVYGTRRPT
jgi:hypothetical protein